MNKDFEKYKGIIVAFYGCYDDEGNVSKERAKELCRFYKDKGIKGLYVGGSSGEAFLQTVEERKMILEAVMEEVKGQLTIIAHVGATATRDSVELAKHAESLGVDAISAVPNVYYGIPERSIERHWKSIIESTKLPFIIYNIPQTTGYNLSANLFKKMLETKRVIGVKNSSMPTLDIQQFKKLGGEDFLVFNGPDEQFIAGRIIGADAGIGGTYGVMPELFVKADEHLKRGEVLKAREIQNAINEVIMELLSFPNLYSAAKEVLKLRGVKVGTTRLPLEPVEQQDMGRIEALYEKVMSYIKQYS